MTVTYENHGLRGPGTRCLRCGTQMTWSEQRRQFGRLLRRGLTTTDAKALMPRCQICLTAILGRKRPGAFSGTLVEENLSAIGDKLLVKEAEELTGIMHLKSASNADLNAKAGAAVVDLGQHRVAARRKGARDAADPVGR
jgi:hypothetical protein